MASKEYEAVLRLLLKLCRLLTTAGPNQRMKSRWVFRTAMYIFRRLIWTLFGQGYKLTPIKDLSQPGQFACKETVTIVGPKGAIEKVRVLGPVRGKSQIEILAGDGFKLGIRLGQAVRRSDRNTGDHYSRPEGAVQTAEGVIVAQRHIHMTPRDAENMECTMVR